MTETTVKKETFIKTILLIEKITSIAKSMKQGELLHMKDEINRLKEISEWLNLSLYHASHIRIQKEWDLEKEDDIRGYLEELDKMVIIWKTSIVRREGLKVEHDFWDIYEWFKFVDINIIYLTVLENFKARPYEQQIQYKQLPRRYTYLKGKIDVETQDFSLLIEYVEMMENHIEDFKWLYEHLEDYRSKMILIGIITYWFGFDIQGLHHMIENMYTDYYDLDITGRSDTDTVLVDGGAFIGDSVLDFINTYGIYKKIYAYEITPSTYLNLATNTRPYHDVVCIQKGISSEQSYMYVDDAENCGGNIIKDNGDVRVEVTTLDEDIAEQIGMIKMDIEGEEKKALAGAKKHILHEKPKLLISAYHLPGDIFDIPKQIDSIRGDYKYYLRFNGHGCLWPCDYVIYAV